MLYFKICGYNDLPTFPSSEEAEKYLVFNKIPELYCNIENLVIHIYTNHRKIKQEIYSESILPSFKKIFSTCKSPRGKIMNSMLLSFWETRFLRTYSGSGSNTYDSYELYKTILTKLNSHIPQETRITRPIFGKQEFDVEIVPSSIQYRELWLMIDNVKYRFYSASYSNSDKNVYGALMPKDPKCLRVTDNKTGKQVEVKGSKIFLDLLKTNNVHIGPKMTIYCSELFQSAIETNIQQMNKDYILVVDKNFKKIYTRNECIGDFHSCMTDKQNHAFYTNHKDTMSAAYILNTQNNKIYARCIIYHNVHLKDKVVNYAERTYSADPLWKYMLITKLIETKQIDCYKTIGAGCSEILSILDTNGKQIPSAKMWIDLSLKSGDIVSYMDTFRYYDPKAKKASNFTLPSNSYRELCSTGLTIAL